MSDRHTKITFGDMRDGRNLGYQSYRAVLLSARGGDRRSQDKLLDCLCERCKPLSILSTVQSTSRSASSAIWFKIAAFALSGSASASRRYRTARAWFLGVIGGTLCAPLLRPDYAPLRTNAQSRLINRDRV